MNHAGRRDAQIVGRSADLLFPPLFEQRLGLRREREEFKLTKGVKGFLEQLVSPVNRDAGLARFRLADDVEAAAENLLDHDHRRLFFKRIAADPPGVRRVAREDLRKNVGIEGFYACTSASRSL